jgi:phage FluMu gp28-like protein
MKELTDTLRVVDWEELPASVREIPDGFNPLDEGVLMKHQAAWCAIQSDIKVADKSRRTGITFAEALDDTVTAASRKSAGGSDVFYIGDTKEKGLEFIGYCAHFAKVIALAQGQGLSSIEEFLFDDQDDKGQTRQISAYRIRFASGFKIVALSSRPANIRGLQGIVVIDEAAYHPNVQGVLDAATALLIWGGKIRVISTHNGKNNPFYTLIKDIQAGVYGESAQVLRVTFDDAVENGIYERVCMMKGTEPTPEGKKDWYTRIRKGYGPRIAAMREELDAIPRDGNGVAIPTVWIENAMPEERPVLRLVLDDDFAAKHEEERISWCEDWIQQYLEPMRELLDPKLDHVFGMDFARHRHFSVIMPGAITENLTRSVPFIIELGKVPTRQQEQILWYLIDMLPRFNGGAMDATGPGQTLAEYTGDKYGEAIHQIVLNRKWYAEFMPKMVGAFEDGSLLLPKDKSTSDDFRAVEIIDGIPMVPQVDKRDIKDPEMFRHGDAAIAGALFWYASLHRTIEAFGYRPVPKNPPLNADQPKRRVRVTAGFSRGVL